MRLGLVFGDGVEKWWEVAYSVASSIFLLSLIVIMFLLGLLLSQVICR
jgi:hypothetical protein